MQKKIPEPLFILEMANNHMGDVSHAFALIKEFGEVCKKFPFKFAFKLQYRDLDNFIHPDAQGREDIKYVKRFSETKLSHTQFNKIIDEIRKNGFLAMATPFDEQSVDLIEEQNLDIIKVASCSFTDWPLLERIIKTNKPIIASTAGATLDDIDRVVNFFQHRNKEFAILHCVGQYPTPDENMHMSQIGYLEKLYQGVRIGFSTHEHPHNMDIIKIAIAKGATIFEKHVGLPTDKYPINGYSSSPKQLTAWLESAQYAMKLCGESNKRLPENKEEKESLQSLRRAVFAKRPIKKGQVIENGDIFFAFPSTLNSITANHWSKYTKFIATQDIKPNDGLTSENISKKDYAADILSIAHKVNDLLKHSKIIFPGAADLEISHHYGIERFNEFGLVLITVVNREYCKKLLISLANQAHPEQFHQKKEETFHILYGEVHLTLNGEMKIYQPGEVVTVQPNVRHSWISPTGAVIEEISSTHFINDSFYTDELINQNKQRKTMLTYWMK
jgi:sialic acid synthase SpsE/mannose-6-phosphate isomerase-like protein (cupin superfamily)